MSGIIRTQDGAAVTDGNPFPTKLTGSNVGYDSTDAAFKSKIVKRGSVTTQTHNAVSVSASSGNLCAVQTATGYDQVSVGLKSDASHTNSISLYWYADSAGTTFIGSETLLSSAGRQEGIQRATVKAPYFKVNLANGDAGAAHTMSSWTTLIP